MTWKKAAISRSAGSSAAMLGSAINRMAVPTIANLAVMDKMTVDVKPSEIPLAHKPLEDCRHDNEADSAQIAQCRNGEDNSGVPGEVLETVGKQAEPGGAESRDGMEYRAPECVVDTGISKHRP